MCKDMQKIYLAKLKYFGSFWWMTDNMFDINGKICSATAKKILDTAIELQYD